MSCTIVLTQEAGLSFCFRQCILVLYDICLNTLTQLCKEDENCSKAWLLFEPQFCSNCRGLLQLHGVFDTESQMLPTAPGLKLPLLFQPLVWKALKLTCQLSKVRTNLEMTPVESQAPQSFPTREKPFLIAEEEKEGKVSRGGIKSGHVPNVFS